MGDLLHTISTFFSDFFGHLMAEHPEHVLFYIINTAMMILVIARNKESFKKGLEGDNGLWEAPEIVTYIWLWMFPQSINAVLFLDLHPPDMFWYFMLLCLFFALAGREGITMLLNWRGIMPAGKASSDPPPSQQTP